MSCASIHGFRILLPSNSCLKILQNFFKNPSKKLAAGFLIEKAGLKGVNQGGAHISNKHANFIVNMGDATAADVFHLIILAMNSKIVGSVIFFSVFKSHSPLRKPLLRISSAFVNDAKHNITKIKKSFFTALFYLRIT